MKWLLTLKSLRFSVEGLNTWKHAQVTAGGISTDEFDPETMESLLVPDYMLQVKSSTFSATAAVIIFSGHGPQVMLLESTPLHHFQIPIKYR